MLNQARGLRGVSCSGLLLLGLGCGGSDGDGGPTAPANRHLGGWSGATSQGKVFHFLVNESGVVLAMIGFRVEGTSCTDDVILFIAREPPMQPFSVSGDAVTITSQGTGGSVTAQATLNDDGSASGTLVVNSIRCSGTLNATFTAQHATGAEVSLAGTWNGTIHSSVVDDDDVTFTVNQAGATLSGTYATVAGGFGDVTGTVSGRMVTFTLTQTTPGCTGRFDGHGVLMPSPEVLVLYYTGNDCLGAHAMGYGSATR